MRKCDENALSNWKDTYRGVVHLSDIVAGGEYTLCGFAFDEPLSEWGADPMESTNEPCTCRDCKRALDVLLPYFKRESRRIKDTSDVNMDL